MGPHINATDEIDVATDVSSSLAGRRMVITGASRGLGAHLVRVFADAGALVAAVARSRTALDDLVASMSTPVLTVVGDVADPETNEAVADAVVSEWGGLDVWISNAGISPVVANPLDVDLALWRQVVDVNLTGAFLGARAAARVMTGGGRIIFTGSVVGERPRGGLAAYSASKAGLVGLAKSLAIDLGAMGITVNVVAPGWFESSLTEGWMRRSDLSEAVIDHTVLRRWGTPDDLAGAYRFLASDASAFVTGTVLSVDGGYLLS